jgi:serine/threonine-protein kinase
VAKPKATRRFSPHTTNATTRTRTISPPTRDEQLVKRGDELASPETALCYRVDRLLGQGGFGQVYLARRLGRSRTVPDSLCIKVSRRIDGWLREAYFGQLLDEHPRAIRIFDAFPIVQADGRPLYCLALEHARHGDLSAFLRRTGRKWRETTARREIAGILQVLGKLHRGQMLHRDLTPMNVFVCDHSRLKLGDFGIVRQQSDKRGITARTLNPLMAPSDIFAGAAPKWQARDDVYQVGQLLGMLIKGEAQARIRAPEVRKLPCSDHLKEIIYRCIGERRKRYESADELIEALSAPPATLKAGALRALKGAHLAFTGIFSKLRRDLMKAAKRAGAVVHSMPSAKTTVVVRGRPNALQAAGRDAGRKLMEIKRLRAKGHRITIISEDQFWRLARPCQSCSRLPAPHSRGRRPGRRGR